MFDTAAAGAVAESLSQGSSNVSPSSSRASRVAKSRPEQSSHISKATPSHSQPSTLAGGSSPFDSPDRSISGTTKSLSCKRAIENILQNVDQIRSVSYGLADVNGVIQLISQAESRVGPARSACCLFNFDSEFSRKENAKQVERMEDFVDDLKDMFKESQGSLYNRYNPYYRLNSLTNSLHNLKDCID